MQKMWGKDPVFYGTLVGLAIPIVVSQLLNAMVGMLDTVMIGRLGEGEIAAVALSNQIAFILFILQFGINSGASIFMAQYWGQGEIEGIHRSTGLSIALSLTASLVFVGIAWILPAQALSLFSQDPAVIEMGVPYLRIVALTFPLTAISNSYMAALRATGQTKIPMYMTILALVSNGIGNALLIFGLLGLPRLGVVGAAIATSIARAIECAVLLGIVYRMKLPIAARFSAMFRIPWSFVQQYIKTATFVIFNELEWAIGNALYNVAYRASGTMAQAAVQIAGTVQNLMMVIAIALGNACAIMIGNRIGEGREDVAFLYAKRCFALTALAGVAMGAILPLLSPLLTGFYNVSPDVVRMAREILLVVAVLSPIRCMEFTLIVGILRSGGDTRFSLLVDLCAVYAVSLPLTFLAAYVWKLPIQWCVLLANSEMLVKCIVVIPRFLSKLWIHNVVVQRAEGADALPSGEVSAT